jgi:hypothetical protein
MGSSTVAGAHPKSNPPIGGFFIALLQQGGWHEFPKCFLGAGIGGALRHGVNLTVLRLGWMSFPVGTLVINVLGSFLIGLIAGAFCRIADESQDRS